MGAVAAIVGASAAVIGAGVSAYSASQRGGATGATTSHVGDLNYLNLADPNSSFAPYESQASYVPALDQFNQLLSTTDNEAFRKQLSSIDPSLLRNVAQVGRNASSYLSGAIPDDVTAEVRRDSAYQALTGGYSGSTMGANLTARDLGLTSLKMQQMGADMTNASMSLDKGLTPYNYTTDSLLYSPQQLLQRRDDQNYYNTDLGNQKQFMDSGHQYASDVAANANRGAGANGIAQALGQLGPAAKGLGTAYRSLSGLWGSGGSRTNATVTQMPDQSQQTVNSTNVDNLSAINLASLTGSTDSIQNQNVQDYITTGTDFSALG